MTRRVGIAGIAVLLLAVTAVAESKFVPSPDAVPFGRYRVTLSPATLAEGENIAGGFTKQFEAIFAKAGMKLSDPANLVNLSGHAGRHSPGYHKHVFDALQKETQGLSGKAYKEALTGALNTLRKELEANPDLVKMRLTIKSQKRLTVGSTASCRSIRWRLQRTTSISMNVIVRSRFS